MSKRNFILLIIILVVAIALFYVFLYLNPGTGTDTTGGSTGTNFISRFNPFGRKDPTQTPNTPDGDNNQPENNPTTEVRKLIKVSTMPVAGYTVFTKERLKEININTISPNPETPILGADGAGTATTTSITTTPSKTTTPAKPTPPPTEFVPALRYVSKSMGIVYQTFADKIEERKISGTTIPVVYDAYFGNNGDSVAMRYLNGDNKTIETFVGTIPKEFLGGDTTNTDKLAGYFLPENIKDISLSQNKSKMFYLFESGENIIGTILNFSDNKKTQIFDSPFTEWLSSWGSDKSITLSTKPSYGVSGYAYTLDTEKRTLNKTLGDMAGLTTLTSPDGKSILFSGSTLTLNIYHTDTGNISPLSIRTLPEKCTWGKSSSVVYCAVPSFSDAGQYPDSWYQGEVSFNDQIWKIDTTSVTGTVIADPEKAVGGEAVDGVNLMLDADENSLFFVNKKDSFLWKFDLR